MAEELGESKSSKVSVKFRRYRQNKLMWSLLQDTDMESSGPEVMVSGNMRRDLWKKTCKAIANNVSLSTVRLHESGADIDHVAF